MARSRKGEREAARILDAATAVLARDGFGGATIGRIAAEAQVDKKMVLYYFSTRESLLARLVTRVGHRVSDNVAAAIAELPDPASVADVGVDKLWEGATEDGALPRAYLALATSGGESVEVRAALAELKSHFLEMADVALTHLEENGYRLRDDRDSFVTLQFAALRGLLLEWTESGDTPALVGARDRFKRAVMDGFEARRVDRSS